jgi:hypothetical protein
MALDKCDCGTTTRIYYADIHLCGEQGPGGAGFHTGEVEVEVCTGCGKSSFVIPAEIQKRFFRS